MSARDHGAATRAPDIPGRALPEALLPGEGPWDLFRRLLRCWRRCIHAEEGAEASARLEERGSRFLWLEGAPPPEPGRPWNAAIRLSPDDAPFLGALESAGEDGLLAVGWPLSVHAVSARNAGRTAILRPVFLFPATCAHDGDLLRVSLAHPAPDANVAWLEQAFGRGADHRRSFLSVCGLVDGGSEAVGAAPPSAADLIRALEDHLPRDIREPLDAHAPIGPPLRGAPLSGIHARAVLVRAARRSYAAGLCKELQYLEGIPDATLDGTALAPLFRRGPAPREEDGPILHEGILPEFGPLNAAQRAAAASLLSRRLTVITGPPGTGKSLVAASAIIGCRLSGRTVLFSGRNHKAVDAVAGRCTGGDGAPLLTRANTRGGPGGGTSFSFRDALRELSAETRDPDAWRALLRLRQDMDDLLNARGREAASAAAILGRFHRLGDMEGDIADLRARAARILGATPPDPADSPGLPEGACRGLLSWARILSSGGLFAALLRLILSPILTGRLRKLREWADAAGIGLPSGLRAALERLSGTAPAWEAILEAAAIRRKAIPLERRLADAPPAADLVRAMRERGGAILRLMPEILACDASARRGLPPGAPPGSGALMREHIPAILEARPAWAVTSLSASGRIPLHPAIFDLAILDEAGQSDIPSAVPILFRARRAGIVGDPRQLPHIVRISEEMHELLLRDAGIPDGAAARFSYRDVSLYDLAAGTPGTAPILLDETWRSAREIAEYSNSLFYGGRLRVATDESALRVPAGTRPGMRWTDVRGRIEADAAGGCTCREEADAVIRILRSWLMDAGFRGSVGVAVPFRRQADLLRRMLAAQDAPFRAALERARCHADTAHGFQGDERDAMIFGLCGGPDMPAGSLRFLRGTGRLFNVAVSRARGLLEIVGDRSWAAQCGIPHIRALAGDASEPLACMEMRLLPWSPYGSPWEAVLRRALEERGLFPAAGADDAGCRADLLLSDAARGMILHVEVDADRRLPENERGTAAIWHDIGLLERGRRVLRIPAWRVREDPAGCAERVLRAWRGLE